MTTLEVGKTVGLVRYTFGGTLLQGLYTITKMNKVRIHFLRNSDGADTTQSCYERVFSAKTFREIGSANPRIHVDFVDVEKYEELQKTNEKNEKIHKLWKQVEEAVYNRDISKSKELLNEIFFLQ